MPATTSVCAAPTPETAACMELAAADAFSMKSILMLSPFLNSNGVLPYITWSGIVSSISICQISIVFTVLRLNTMLDVVNSNWFCLVPSSKDEFRI